MPTGDATAHAQHQSDELDTPPDLLAENISLREELAKVREERLIVLNHSIESDQRLLQYTDSVFLSPVTTSHPCDGDTSLKEKLNSVTRELEDAKEKIKNLEGIISSYNGLCHGCKVQAEETKNMITAIRCLEEHIKSLTEDRMKPTPDAASTTHNVCLSNRFSILSSPEAQDGEDNNSDFVTVSSKRNKGPTSKIKKVLKRREGKHTTQMGSNIKVNVPFRNLSLVGDSHARLLTSLMKPMVHNSTMLSGMCKPGAGLQHIAPTSPPPPDNCYILMAGTNDVANHREDIFYKIEDVIRRCSSSSSMLLLPLPPRYDLPPNDSIHRTIDQVNSYMRGVCRRYDGVSVLDISGIGRRYYTSHGLHLRASGKKLLARLIVENLALMKPRRAPAPRSTARIATPTVAISPGCGTYAAAVRQASPPQASTTPPPANGVLNQHQQLDDICKNNVSFLGPPLFSTGQN